ncbi:hypothetical protein [Haloquadratum walsbyi]|jgi:hypothetical protein|uniref:DUF1102 domain-containing protein n=1 Tax=Haloquadratum walsbyi J07HQW2 TaxID=1238425 RepID=U1PPA1_9EURY|nr:hypothetical protein [Haloquadratum walsbyi]ERG94126.1 MAG: hypothetical protein J07HQW2_00560 [Haloquadratum walsbyi J07HQW2]
MKRRNYLLGLGSLAVASTAALSTGASVQSTAEREGGINVVNDSTGLLAFQLGPNTNGGVVLENPTTGQIGIDFTGGGSAGGVNVNSKYQIGSLRFISEADNLPGLGNGPTDNPGFMIVNNDTVPRNVTVEFDVTDKVNLAGSKLILQGRPSRNGVVSDVERTKTIRLTAGNDNDSFSFNDSAGPNSTRDDRLEPGEFIGISLIVDTTAAVDDLEDLSGTLTISAN